MSDPVCQFCKEPAACYGAYENQPEGYACNECCGHGNEDGHCRYVMPKQVHGDVVCWREIDDDSDFDD